MNIKLKLTPSLQAGYNHGEEVLMSISLQRVTVTSVGSSRVLMSHPLKRISYATCDPASCLFSFMARHPASEHHLQQCHTFRLDTPHQAEELNTILGTAFRMAYAATLTAQKVLGMKNFLDFGNFTRELPNVINDSFQIGAKVMKIF